MNDNERIRRAFGPELHEAFEVWARCMRPTIKAGTSPTHDICQRLAQLAGVVEVVAAAGMMESDRLKGEEVERAWSFTKCDVRWKLALASYYVGGLSIPVVARRAKASLSMTVDGIISCGHAVNRTRLTIQQHGEPSDNRAYNL